MVTRSVLLVIRVAVPPPVATLALLRLGPSGLLLLDALARAARRRIGTSAAGAAWRPEVSRSTAPGPAEAAGTRGSAEAAGTRGSARTTRASRRAAGASGAAGTRGSAEAAGTRRSAEAAGARSGGLRLGLLDDDRAALQDAPR